MVHQNFGPESAVASLIDGSMLDPSILSGSGSGVRDYRDSQLSYEEPGKLSDSRDISPVKQTIARKPVSTASNDRPASASREVEEYDINEYGQKVPMTKEHESPTASEAAITSAALGRAAAAALKRQNAVHHSPSRERNNESFTGEGVSRNRSFKERAAKDRYTPTDVEPRHSIDRLSDYDHPKMGVSGLPDMDHPMPEIGYGYGAHSGVGTPSQEPLTPTRQKAHSYDDRAVTPKASQGGLGMAAAATIATAGALASSHSREPSQDQDMDWQRTSTDRKRDTLITNPYEGSSPIANLPGLDSNMLHGGDFVNDTYRGGFHTGSPGLGGGDEGYISAAPNDGANMKGKGVGIPEQQGMGNSDDPFFGVKNPRNISGLSQGLGSPLYDASTGTGIDRIQSKDIIALMEHVSPRNFH